MYRQGPFWPVTITIYVQNSNEAAFTSFNLYKLQNTVLEKDVIGKIDNEARTITLLLPKGTDVSRLTPNMDYGAGSGAALDWAFANGTSHDFFQSGRICSDSSGWSDEDNLYCYRSIL